MSGVSVVFLLLVASALCQFIIGGVAAFRRKKLRHYIRVIGTQRHFATLRQRLFDLMLSDQLDGHSQTFKKLYLLQTYIIRHSDHYADLSRFLREMTYGGAAFTTAVRDEVPKWSTEVRTVVRDTASGLGRLENDYSALRRVTKWLRTRYLHMRRFEVRMKPKMSWRIHRALDSAAHACDSAGLLEPVDILHSSMWGLAGASEEFSEHVRQAAQ